MSFLWLTCPTTSLHSLHCSLKFEQAKLCPSSPIKFPGGERSSRNAGWSNSLLIDQTCSAQKCCLSASSSYVPRLLCSALSSGSPHTVSDSRSFTEWLPFNASPAGFHTYRAPKPHHHPPSGRYLACQESNSALWHSVLPLWPKLSWFFWINTY